MPIGAETPFPVPFPDENMRNIRFFRQRWDPDWLFDATEDLENNLVSPTIWNTLNPGRPTPVDASGNPIGKTEEVATSPIRPYYFDPDCPPMGESISVSGADPMSNPSGRGAWLSFDTMRIDYSASGTAGPTVSIAGGGNNYPFWAVPSHGYIVGAVYLWDEQDSGLPSNNRYPDNCSLQVRVQASETRLIRLPMNTAPVVTLPTVHENPQRKRMSFYLWTNAYDYVDIRQEAWDSANSFQFARNVTVSLFWKESQPGHGVNEPVFQPPAS